MKVIIAGSRSITLEPSVIKGLMDTFHIKPSVIVCGGARGMDTSGELYAAFYNVEVDYFLPDWDRLGRGAGFVRNTQMANYGDALLIVWDGYSKGSNHMKDKMLSLNKPVYEVILKTHNEGTE
jgi:hypothetical protein